MAVDLVKPLTNRNCLSRHRFPACDSHSQRHVDGVDAIMSSVLGGPLEKREVNYKLPFSPIMVDSDGKKHTHLEGDSSRSISTEDGRNEAPCCRICLSTDDSTEQLIHPCACKGSIRYVHSKCLVRWLQTQQVKQPCCDICGCTLNIVMGRGQSEGAVRLSRYIDDTALNDTYGVLAPQLVSALQAFTTNVVHLLSSTLMLVSRIAIIVLSKLVPNLNKSLHCILSAIIFSLIVMAAILEFTTLFFNACGTVAKVMMLAGGPQWRPSHWGTVGTEVVGPCLDMVRDALASTGVMVGTHAVLMVAMSTRCLFAAWDAPLHFVDKGLPGISAVMPTAESSLLLTQEWLMLCSSLLNFVTVLWLIKCAFFHKALIPVEVLNANSLSQKKVLPQFC